MCVVMLQKEVVQWQQQLKVLQERLDRVHTAHKQAEEEEGMLQQLKLACLLPEEQQHASAMHQLSGVLPALLANPACACSIARKCSIQLLASSQITWGMQKHVAGPHTKCCCEPELDGPYSHICRSTQDTLVLISTSLCVNIVITA